MITITESAAEKIKELTPDPKYALRMRVVGGGCSGLQYQMGPGRRREFLGQGAYQQRYQGAGGYEERPLPCGRRSRLHQRPDGVWLQDHQPQRQDDLRLRAVVPLNCVSEYTAPKNAPALWGLQRSCPLARHNSSPLSRALMESTAHV